MPTYIRTTVRSLVSPLSSLHLHLHPCSFPNAKLGTPLTSMHSPSFAVFATVFALFSGSFASPINQLEARSQHAPATCHPNFEGVGVSITNSAVEWGTAPASVPGAYINNFSHRGPMLMHPDFRPEQDGQDPSQYIIK
ncbi:hypothetical protein AX16_007315 [Volvariella volvacea WC 439]|nr:hypothetical protein AX16_007315 [Volvariella volvacea WC 439]